MTKTIAYCRNGSPVSSSHPNGWNGGVWESIWQKFPAMISEILCKTWAGIYILWNRRAWIALNYLEVENLPKYDYQITGKRYRELCRIGLEISDRFREHGIEDNDQLIFRDGI